MVTMLGLEFAPLSIPMERRLQMLGVLTHVTSFFFGFTAAPILIALLYTRFYYLTILYVGWYIYDLGVHNRGGRICRWVRRWKIWRYYRDYFPVKLVKTAELDPNKNYIIGYHPHGIMAIGAFINFGTEATGFSKFFPGITTRMLTLVMNFFFPVARELALCLGIAPASKESIDWLLTKEGTGQALVIVIGGAAEALDAHPDSNIRLTLKRRKGFVRMALKYGASLVPSFGFGENEVYAQLDNPDGSMIRKVQEKVKSIMGFSTPLIRGRGILQYTVGLIPYRRPITLVVGKPIDVERNENPSAEDVEKLHEKYIQALQDLYDEYKDKYASNPHLKLEI